MQVADSAWGPWLTHANWLERPIYRAVCLLILLTALGCAYVAAHRRMLLAAMLPLAWVAAFWGVHLVFEIQGRYFLALYLVLPVICALLWRLLVPGRRRSGLAAPAAHRQY